MGMVGMLPACKHSRAEVSLDCHSFKDVEVYFFFKRRGLTKDAFRKIGYLLGLRLPKLCHSMVICC